MYPLMKDIIKSEKLFQSSQYFPARSGQRSLSNSKDLGLSKSKKKRKSTKRKSNSILVKNKMAKQNSFIQKLTKKKEVEASDETAASIGNMKRQFINSVKPKVKNKSVKRTKGISEIVAGNHLFSPQQQFDILSSLE